MLQCTASFFKHVIHKILTDFSHKTHSAPQDPVPLGLGTQKLHELTDFRAITVLKTIFPPRHGDSFLLL